MYKWALYLGIAFDSSAERVGQTVQWRGRTYIYTYGEYDTKRKIAVTRDYKWRLTSIEGDPEHNFIEFSSFLDNYLYVDKDYEIPISGEITAVYVGNNKVDNEIFCNTIDSIINGTGDTFEFDSDGLYQDARRIYLCYETVL